MAQKDPRNPGYRLKPVEHIELSERNTRLRIVLVAGLILIGAVAIVAGLNALLTRDAGWTEITVSDYREPTCAAEMKFSYLIGRSGQNATVEYKKAAAVYQTAAAEAYKLFSADEEFENVNNLRSINDHPNEALTVAPELYAALEQCGRYGCRLPYLAPVYDVYSSLFFCDYDYEAENFDPVRNEEVRAAAAECAAFAADSAAVNLELGGNSTVTLRVSDEYAAYAKENGIDKYVDLFWMKNAFVVDYIAEKLIENGFTNGYLESVDGFSRGLGGADVTVGCNFYDRVGNKIYLAADLDAGGVSAMAALRDFPVGDGVEQWYYSFDDGSIRTPYVSLADGMSRGAVSSMTLYSRGEVGCAELAMLGAGAYIADELSAESLAVIRGAGAEYVYAENGEVCRSDAALRVTKLYNDGAVSYTDVYIAAPQ